MTEIQEQRIKRDAKILALLTYSPQETYQQVADKFRVSVIVVERVARQNNIHRKSGPKPKQAVANA